MPGRWPRTSLSAWTWPTGMRPGGLLCATPKRRHIDAFDLTDNEMAKLHVRHLVAGMPPQAEHEIAVPLRIPRAARAR